MSSRHLPVKILLSGLIAALILGLGCGDDDDPPSSSGTTLKFPIRIGNIWEYSRTFYAANFDPPELEQTFGDTAFAQSVTYILRKDTLSDTLETFVFKTMWLEDFDGNYMLEYFNNAGDGMYGYAYSTPPNWIGPPKKATTDGIYYNFKGLRYQNLDDLFANVYEKINSMPGKAADSTFLEEPPIQELMYPIEVGQRWIYRSTDYGHALDMEKEIMGRETIEVPAGSFSCYQVQWFWDWDDDGEWETDIEGYDYLCDAGIVKRAFAFFGIQVTDEFGTPLGSFDSYDIYELTGYSLK
jgi:hypothetical protein